MTLTFHSPRLLPMLAFAVASGLAAPLFASVNDATALTVETLVSGQVLARRGADDRGNHHGAGHAALQTAPLVQTARNGADDGPKHDIGDDRGGRGRRGRG